MFNGNEITEILVSAAKARKITDILELTGKQLEKIPGIDGYLINLLDASGNTLVCQHVRLMPEFRQLEYTYLDQKIGIQDQNFNSRIFNNRTVERLTAENASEQELKVLLYWNVQECIGIPIIDPDDEQAPPIGVLVIMHRPARLADEALHAARHVIQILYVSLANWLRKAHLEELHQEATNAVNANRRLINFLNEMSELTSVDKIYQLFAAELFHHLKFEIAAFVTLEDGELQLEKIVGATPELQVMADAWKEFLKPYPYQMDATASGAVYVFMRNAPLVIPDLQQVMHLPMAEHDRRSLTFLGKPRTLYLTPIRYRKQAIGTFGLYSMSAPINLSDADLQLLEQLPSLLGTALQSSRLYATSQEQNAEISRLNLELQEKVEQLASLALTDQLTGLFNFRSFEQELDRRLQEVERGSDKTELSLILFDIDHFKSFNDRLGHAAGNDVLSGIAQEINRHIRRTDMACRYGGEEFVVILPKCDLDGAQLLAERIRDGIQKTIFSTCKGDQKITISAGCTVSKPGDTQLTLFARADEALYAAKAQGRNRVHSL